MPDIRSIALAFVLAILASACPAQGPAPQSFSMPGGADRGSFGSHPSGALTRPLHGADRLNELRSPDAQRRLLEGMPVPEGLRSAIAAGSPAAPVPPGAIRLLGDPVFSFSQASTNVSSALERFSRAIPFREVDTEKGVEKLFENPPPGGIPPLSQDILATDAEKQRQKTCGAIVKRLRAPLDVQDPIPRNRITHFNEACLFAGAGALQPLTPLQTSAATTCANLYAEFLAACLPPAISEQQHAKLDQLMGIIFVDQNQADPRSAAEIVCSGLLVGASEVLTARHCLASLIGIPNAALRFLPIAARTSLTNPAAPSKSGVKLVSISVPASAAGQTLRAFASTPFARDADIVVLRTDVAPYGASVLQRLPLGNGTAWQRAAIGGFHRFAYRAMLLRARIEGKPFATHADLIASGDWVRTFLVDGTPTCRLQTLTAQERTDLNVTSDRMLGHYCQSHERGSGGSLLLLSDNPADQSIMLAGVHVGNQRTPVTGDVEDFGSSNYAVLFDAELASRLPGL